MAGEVRVWIDSFELVIGSGRDDSDRDGAELQNHDATLQDILWPVAAGSRSISIDVKYTPNSAPRPRLVVKANASIGIDADVEGVAPAGTGWETITVEVSPDASGVLEVWREVRTSDGSGSALWDVLNITQT